MILRSIELKNFRQYYGVQRIDFSTDTEKNITLIHAENGVGKTALLNAILWCFYERTTPNFKIPKVLMNNWAKRNGEQGFYVSIEFEEGGNIYSVRRSENSLSDKTFQVWAMKGDGNYDEVPNGSFFLNSIIPSDMANYFFFQGEGMNTIVEGDKSLRSAVRDILGFSVAEKALESIRTVRVDYRKEYERLDKHSELGKLQKQLANLESERELSIQRLDQLSKEEVDLSNRVKKVDEDLRNSNHDVVSQKQRLRGQKENELASLGGALTRAKADKAKLVRNYSISAFAQKAAKLGIEFIDDEELKGRIPEPYNVELVESILKDQVCICGGEVKLGTEAYGNIQKLLGTATDPQLVNRVTRARGQLTAIKRDLRRAPEEFRDNQRYLSEAYANLDRVKLELESISTEIRGIDFEDIGKQEKLRVQYDRQLKGTFKQRASAEFKLGQLKKDIEKYEGEVSRIANNEPQARKFQNRLEQTKNLEHKLEKLLEDTERETRRVLMTEINKFLDKFVRQDYKATMTEDYNLRLKDRHGQDVGKSDGQTLLLSLTFISALISLAKLRANAKSGVLTPGVVAPFVIDAPFGVLDNTYKANVAAEIPNSVNQVVLLLSSGHWEGTVENVIRAKVGKEYNLVLEVANDQGERSVDEIRLGRRRYPTVRYDCEIDRTVVEEIEYAG